MSRQKKKKKQKNKKPRVQKNTLPTHLQVNILGWVKTHLDGVTIRTMCVSVTQLCLTLCDPMGCCLPGSSVHGISQARILQWVAISFSGGSSQPRGQTHVSCTAGRSFTSELPGMPMSGLFTF